MAIIKNTEVSAISQVMFQSGNNVKTLHIVLTETPSFSIKITNVFHDFHTLFLVLSFEATQTIPLLLLES